MDNNSSFTENNLVSDPTNGNLKLSPDESPSQVDATKFLLPRSAWSSQVAYLRVLFRAKKALDRIEQETKYEYSVLEHPVHQPLKWINK
ncbi:MAG: hypothetical protein RM347_014815 [Nostoc sp. ChiQUE02]|uniref:hypothetical protein n=1 Tax=Nostoc sp. ChiQUE02 TaxID=3075377 RepID=UPI002AD3B19D|nr:hypothetical protein [Nostoc sp. ChiQUE02]MDZ8229614.1 hypothetical protein [Nostoc sp. ChiQUE02]